MVSIEEFPIKCRKLYQWHLSEIPNGLYSYDLGYRLTINPSQVHNKASDSARISGSVGLDIFCCPISNGYVHGELQPKFGTVFGSHEISVAM